MRTRDVHPCVCAHAGMAAPPPEYLACHEMDSTDAQACMAVGHLPNDDNEFNCLGCSCCAIAGGCVRRFAWSTLGLGWSEHRYMHSWQACMIT